MLKHVLLTGLICFANPTQGSIGTVPQRATPVRTGSTGSIGSTGSGTRYSDIARPGSQASLLDEKSLEHAVTTYNALVEVIRDIILKAKLTPIGGTEGLSYIESCAEHKSKTTKGPTETKSGMYTIWPTGKVLDGSKQVWCDMETEGGGWTVIQRRGYGTVSRANAENFNKNWKEYKVGFGTPLNDYWLGLDSMVSMSMRCSNELQVVLTYFDDTVKTATYSNFTIGPETDNYRLHLTGFTTGNAGDVFEKKHDGIVFNTPDRDNDDKCAGETKSGWWFVSKKTKNWCAYVDLNAELKNTATDVGGMTWRYSSLLKGWTAPAIKKAEMKIRPKCPPSH